jgi:hypothetical protein
MTMQSKVVVPRRARASAALATAVISTPSDASSCSMLSRWRSSSSTTSTRLSSCDSFVSSLPMASTICSRLTGLRM